MKRPEVMKSGMKSSGRSPIERGCDITMKVADAPFYEYYHHFHSRRHSSAKTQSIFTLFWYEYHLHSVE